MRPAASKPTSYRARYGCRLPVVRKSCSWPSTHRAADLQSPTQPMFGRGEGGGRVAAGDLPGRADELSPLDRLLDRQHRRPRLDFDFHQRLRGGDGVTTFPGDGDDRLTTEVDDL